MLYENFKPFTDMRTGKKINTPEQDIDEMYSLSHYVPTRVQRVQTKYGLWLHGECPRCKEPIDNWYHPYYCGVCGSKINWDNIKG